MELIKCKYCGGLVLRKDGLTSECQSCGQSYDVSYQTEYKDKTGFFAEYGPQVKQCINGMKTDELSSIISLFLITKNLSLDEDEVFYSKYEVEYTIICVIAEIVGGYAQTFGTHPYSTNALTDLVNVVINCSDLLYGVAQKTENKIDYVYLMNWFSNYLYSYVSRAYNYGSDKWNKKSHEEDSNGWTEFINIMANCVVVLDVIDRHGDCNIESVYRNMITIQERILSLTYTHRYWIGNYHATEQIGLDASSKESQRKKLETYKARYNRVLRKKQTIQEKRQKEEQDKLEAEKKKRIDDFWLANESLKNDLLKQKSDLENEIVVLESKKATINADKEISELKEEIQLANSTLATLGLFAIKEKKNKREQIAKLEKELQDVKTRVKNEKDNVQKEIDKKKVKISDIENEFTRDR